MFDWEPKKLIDLAEYLNGYAFSPEDWGVEGLPIIRIEQLKNPTAPTDFYAGKLPEKNIIDDGDLIFSWSASLFLRIWAHGKSALNQHLFKVVEKKGIDRTFLKAFIEFYLPELTKASHGSTMQHITRKELDRFSALFPSDEAEQKNIAVIIGQLDQAIEQTEAIIAKQQRIKTGLMQDLLTKGIDENGNIRSEATHEFKDSPLGRIPVEWDAKPLIDVCDKITDGVHMSVKKQESGIPFLFVSCIRDGRISFINASFVDYSTYKVISKGCEPKIGAVLYTVVGSYGHAAEIFSDNPFAFERNIAYLVPIQSQLNATYLSAWLNSDQGRRTADKFALGNAQKLISLGQLSEFQLPIPTIPEQERFSHALSCIEGTITSSMFSLHKLRSLKYGLMHDLLSGKVRVTDTQNQTLTSESL